MIINKPFVTLSLAAALSVLDAASAPASDQSHHDDHGGFVKPGNLDGVNPVRHSEIFGNPAVAWAYGFVQSRDGVWHVRSDWRGEAISPAARAYGYDRR
jgi:hypothetical protein